MSSSLRSLKSLLLDKEAFPNMSAHMNTLCLYLHFLGGGRFSCAASSTSPHSFLSKSSISTLVPMHKYEMYMCNYILYVYACVMVVMC